MASHLTSEQQAKLGQITKAMTRLDAGTYGRCVVCGDPITFERLLVFPEAPNCAECVGR